MSLDIQNFIAEEFARLEHEERSHRAKAAWQRKRGRAYSAAQVNREHLQTMPTGAFSGAHLDCKAAIPSN